jgi:hypothetical protein
MDSISPFVLSEWNEGGVLENVVKLNLGDCGFSKF